MVVSSSVIAFQARAYSSASEHNLREFLAHESQRKQFVARHFWRLLCLVPLAFAVGLFGLAYYVAGIVFPIQATIVGWDTIHSENECEHELARWLLTYGILGIAATLFVCCGRPTIRFGDQVRESGPSTLETVVDVVQFVWLIYGAYLYFHRRDRYQECSASQYEVYRIIINFAFFGMVALMAAGSLLVCLGLPVVFDLGQELRREVDVEQPILTEPMLVTGDTMGNRFSSTHPSQVQNPIGDELTDARQNQS